MRIQGVGDDFGDDDFPSAPFGQTDSEREREREALIRRMERSGSTKFTDASRFRCAHCFSKPAVFVGAAERWVTKCVCCLFPMQSSMLFNCSWRLSSSCVRGISSQNDDGFGLLRFSFIHTSSLPPSPSPSLSRLPKEKPAPLPAPLFLPSEAHPATKTYTIIDRGMRYTESAGPARTEDVELGAEIESLLEGDDPLNDLCGSIFRPPKPIVDIPASSHDEGQVDRLRRDASGYDDHDDDDEDAAPPLPASMLASFEHSSAPEPEVTGDPCVPHTCSFF
jgi:hypothetical protein